MTAEENPQDILFSIIATINEDIALNQSVVERASAIVADTWGNDFDIMKLDEAYPDLIRIAELASDIETLQEDDPYVTDLWNKLTESFNEFKSSLKSENSTLD